MRGVAREGFHESMLVPDREGSLCWLGQKEFRQQLLTLKLLSIHRRLRRAVLNVI